MGSARICTPATTWTPCTNAAEKPLYIVTAQNLDQYAAHLGDGQKALLRKYPQSFRLPVYASHRDFHYADRVCAIVRKNAPVAEVRAVIIDDHDVV